MRQHDHYQLLGLDVSASQQEVEAAVRRLQDRADALAYTSPQQSRELWQRIRQMKKDLLASPARRQAYDQTLHARPATGASPRTAPIVPAVPPRSHPRPSPNGATSIRWPVLAGVGAIVLAALIIAFAGQMALSSAGPFLTSTPVALTLSTAGTPQGVAYRSGQPVQLQWSRMPRATRYRLQIATSLGSGSAGVFQHPLRTVLTPNTSYTLQVVGAQQYYWRVQAYVDGHWTHYTAVQQFAVARPRIGIPAPLTPSDGAASAATRIHLCWARVTSASGYNVRIMSVKALRTRATCEWMSVTPRTYRWSVAALVRAAHTYVGPYSPTARFTILEQIKRTSRRRLAAKRSPRHVLVAVASPVHRVALHPVRAAGRSVAPALRGGRASPVRIAVRQQPPVPRSIALRAPPRPAIAPRRTRRPVPVGGVPATVHQPLRRPAAAPPAVGGPPRYASPARFAPPRTARPPRSAPPPRTNPPPQTAALPQPASPPPAGAAPSGPSPPTSRGRQPLSPCTPALPPIPRGCTNPNPSPQPRTSPQPAPPPAPGPGASFRPSPPPPQP